MVLKSGERSFSTARVISTTKSTIRAATPACIPFSTAAMTVLAATAAYHFETTDKMTRGGITEQIPLMTSPTIPAARYPAREAILTAIAPGVDWAMAAMRISSSSSNRCFFSTKYFLIMGTTTYPPPKVKALINRLIQASHSHSFIFSLILKSSLRRQYNPCTAICKTI